MLRPGQVKASAEDAASMTPRTMAVAERYGELRRLPVSIVVGAGNQIVDVGRQSARLHDVLPHSDLRVVPGLGHMVHHGAPGLVAEAVEAVAATARERSPATAASVAVPGRAATPVVPEHA